LDTTTLSAWPAGDAQARRVGRAGIGGAAVGLVVAVDVASEQPATLPPVVVAAAAAIGAGAEQRALAGDRRGAAGVSQGRQEVALRHLQPVTTQQAVQRRQRDAGQDGADGQYHDLFDEAESALKAARGRTPWRRRHLASLRFAEACMLGRRPGPASSPRPLAVSDSADGGCQQGGFKMPPPAHICS